MNILEIVSGAEVNGAVIHCMLLARGLAKRGHRVTLLCRPNAFIAQQLAHDDIEIIPSDMHRLPLDELKRIAQECKRREIEVIHTHMTRAHNFGVCLRGMTRIPCVATAHSHIVQPHWIFNDHVVAVSDATRCFQRRRNFVRQNRIETVHGFMDYSRFASVPVEAGLAIRSEWNVPPSAPLLGIIGDIIPRKGQLFLVRAYAMIRRQFPNARLVVVGEPKRGTEYYERARAESEKLGVGADIIWAGHRNDIPQVMSALDVYVLASLDEMFPVAVLEAMAAGRAIVATRVGGVPECITHGSTGLLVAPTDHEALANAIVQLLGDPDSRMEMGQRASGVARTEFSVESQTPRMEEVFERVISRSHTRKV